MQKTATFKRYVIFDLEDKTFWNDEDGHKPDLSAATLFVDSDDALESIEDSNEVVKEIEVTYKVTTL